MKKRYIKISVVLATIIICLFFLFDRNLSNDNSADAVHGIVVQTLQDKSLAAGSNTYGKVQVKIISGDHKGQIVVIDNMINDKTSHEAFAKKGDEVLLNIDEDNSGHIKKAYMYEIVRYKIILALGAFFVGLLALIGGKKGVKSILALIITGAAVIKIIIPLTIIGFNPMIVSIIVCIVVSMINLIIISGKNKKTAAAIIGTVGGVIIAGIIAAVSINLLRLIGLTDEEAQMLIYISQNTSFNFKGLLFAGMLMGALGAVMDVSMSIASSMDEIRKSNEEISTRDLIKSGMNVGKDIMGTMANTLILAYAGGSMYVLMLMNSYNLSLLRTLNQDVMASEIVKTLSGSIGLILTIPITAVASAIIQNRNPKKQDYN
ncbi:MAG: YibE/F family protein [Bacillota bacterium]|nr:YibE/F family protein [Bacillota bacterium]